MTTMTQAIEFPHRKQVFENKLPILISCRIRLNDEQRTKLKAAYSDFRQKNLKPSEPAVGGSSIRTITATAPPSLLNNWSDLVVSDLISTRETIPLTTIIQLQKALDIEVVTDKDILTACKGYVEYVFAHGAEE